MRSEPEVLVGDGFFQWTSFALAHRLRHGTPLVVCYERTFHTERHAQRLRTWYRRQALRFVDAMSVNGSLSREYSQWLGMSPERITTGQMVADTENLSRLVSRVNRAECAALRGKWGDPDWVFVAVGRLVPCKGLSELFRGWKRLEEAGVDDCRLVLIGGGPLDKDLRYEAQSLGLRRVFFEGHVDYDAIAQYYASADVFVMPTLEDNWSLVVPEAMACGLPVLCSRYNGCFPELIEPGGNGWVFDPLDETDTFEALTRCVEYRDKLASMGARSREIVSEHTPQHAADAIFRACELAIAHRRK
ncbi:MAG: glycosyltransferase [Verrucomicrobia bacterium]|nr:glycosyltransferase [Verrucomicrobiota bacterium]